MRHVAYCIAFLAAAGMAFGQVGGTGSIQGTVTDPSGAVVAGASVTATNVATGVRTDRKTTDAGFFVLSLLPAGDYTVTVKATGFQTLNQTARDCGCAGHRGIGIPSCRSEPPTNRSPWKPRPSMLKTDDVALGSSVENNVYDSLPLAMNGAARDPSAFAGLAVGVNNYSTQAAGPSTGSFNGGQTYQNEVYIEGLPLTSAGTESDTRNLAFGVSVEAVDQFQVETSGAKAMYEGPGRVELRFQIGNQPVPRRRFRILPEYRFRRPRLLRADHAHRASERIRRHASAAPSRRTSSSSSATTMDTVSFRLLLRATSPYRPRPSGRAISAPFRR